MGYIGWSYRWICSTSLLTTFTCAVLVTKWLGDLKKSIKSHTRSDIWADMPVLTDVFKKIHRLFKWSEHMFSYRCVRERLFQPWPSYIEYGSELQLDGPVVYKRQSEFVKNPSIGVKVGDD